MELRATIYAMSDMQIRILEDEIRDLKRILQADQALLASLKSPERRLALEKEIGGLEYKIDRLRENIERAKKYD